VNTVENEDLSLTIEDITPDEWSQLRIKGLNSLLKKTKKTDYHTQAISDIGSLKDQQHSETTGADYASNEEDDSYLVQIGIIEILMEAMDETEGKESNI
jgi:hypothetical protein